jgi:pimeloyl-ACP methyl ester carboxylesterase
MPSIAIHGQDLHYLDCGAGFPILFGGSYLWDAAVWAPQVEGLSTRYRCIVPELWGYGKSGAIPEMPYAMSKQFLAAWLGVWFARALRKQVDYLMPENQILNEKLGDRELDLTNADRRRLSVGGGPIQVALNVTKPLPP